MTLLPLRVPSAGPSKSTSLAKHQQLEAERHALSQQRSILLNLEQRLRTITDEPRWNVNVPLGPLAWMPGQLVNTNTVKVRLSEEYIVEYSAKQAVEVARRRRQDLDERISQVEKALKQVDQTVSKDLQLPDGWSVNGSNEIVNESGLPCYEIREELSDLEDNQDVEAQRRHVAEAELESEREEAVARASRPPLDLEALFAEAEKEEALERAAEQDDSMDEDEAYRPPEKPEPGHIMDLDEPSVSHAPPSPPRTAPSESPSSDPQQLQQTSDNQPSLESSPSSQDASSHPHPVLKSILSSSKLNAGDSDGTLSPASTAPGTPRNAPKKTVKWNVSGPQPEAESEPSKKKQRKAIILPPPDGSTLPSPTPVSAPMKSQVVERPFQQSVQNEVVERPTANQVQPPTGPKLHRFEEIGSESDEDDDLDGDYDEWNSEDDAADDFDALMLQRELAMQYHAKRNELGAGANTSALGGTINPDAWQLGNQDFVPEDASLATGQHTASQASRFSGGPMQHSRLVVPSLLQQAGLQPGDVLDNAPWAMLHGRQYTPEEEAKIQERINRLALGEELDHEDKDHPQQTGEQPQQQEPQPQVIDLEDALTEAIQPQKKPMGSDVVDKPVVINRGTSDTSTPAPPANKPKRVSRFKAARQGDI